MPRWKRPKKKIRYSPVKCANVVSRLQSRLRYGLGCGRNVRVVDKRKRGDESMYEPNRVVVGGDVEGIKDGSSSHRMMVDEVDHGTADMSWTHALVKDTGGSETVEMSGTRVLTKGTGVGDIVEMSGTRVRTEGTKGTYETGESSNAVALAKETGKQAIVLTGISASDSSDGGDGEFSVPMTDVTSSALQTLGYAGKLDICLSKLSEIKEEVADLVATFPGLDSSKIIQRFDELKMLNEKELIVQQQVNGTVAVVSCYSEVIVTSMNVYRSLLPDLPRSTILYTPKDSPDLVELYLTALSDGFRLWCY